MLRPRLYHVSAIIVLILAILLGAGSAGGGTGVALASIPRWLHSACEDGGFHMFFNVWGANGNQVDDDDPHGPQPLRPGVDGDIETANAEACWNGVASPLKSADATLTVSGLGYSLKAPNLGMNGFCLKYDNGNCVKSVTWTFFSFQFSMDGFAPRGTASHSVSLTWNGHSGTRSFQVLPRPIVLIHGLKSNPRSWQNWYLPGGYLCTHGYPTDAEYTLPEDYWQLSYPGEHPTWNPNWCGFPVDTMDTSSKHSKSIDQNAQALADYLQVMFDTAGAPKVDLVGHSMGGLIARWYISNLMPHDQVYHTTGGGQIRWQPVTRLAMLGTPNMGSYAAVEGSIIRKLSFGLLGKYIPQPATDQNSPAFVRNVVNTAAADRHHVHFFAIGGDLGQAGNGGECLSLDGYPSDLVVNRQSTKWVLGSSEYVDMSTTHIGRPLACRTAHDGPEQQSETDFQTVLQFLQNPEDATPIGGDTQQLVRAPLQTGPQTEGTATAARGALLAPGKSVIVTTRSAPGAPGLNALVGIDPALPHPQLTLTAPDGAISTPQQPRPGVTFEDLSSAGSDVPPVVALSVTSPRAGIWRLTATNPSNSKVSSMPVVPMFTTDEAAGMEVQAATDQPAYAPSGSVTLTAQVTGTKPTSVGGEIDSADTSSFVPVRLTLAPNARFANGVYGVTFRAPTTPGPYEASVTASNGSAQSFDVAEFTVSGLVVRSSADGACPANASTQNPMTLRCAIAAANAGSGGGAIAFAIPPHDPGCSGAVCTMAPTSALPAITAPDTVIDGSSQGGATVNTQTRGDTAHLPIRIDGAGAGSGADGLTVNAPGVTVQGLEVTRFSGNGITLTGMDDTVAGSFVGTDGAAAQGNGGCGISVQGAQNIEIGGTTTAARDLVSGNAGDGVCFTFGKSASPRGRIEGNEIGTNAAGAEAVPNQAGISLSRSGSVEISSNLISGNHADGIALTGGQSTTIRGNLIGVTATGTSILGNGGNGMTLANSPYNALVIDNLVGGNALNGIELAGMGAPGTTISGNAIGTDQSGKTSLPNGQNGIYLHRETNDALIGGSSPGAGNLIANNGDDGVLIGSSPSDSGTTGNAVSRNSIWNNGRLGIDLAPAGTVNCATRTPGPNAYTPCPVISRVTSTTVSGTACAGCTVEIFVAQPGGSDRNHGQGKTFLGSTIATSNGTWTLQNLSLTSGTILTATATTGGNSPESSEFSANSRVS